MSLPCKTGLVLQEVVLDELEKQLLQERKMKKLKPLCKVFRKEGTCRESCITGDNFAHGERCKASSAENLCKSKL